MITSIENDLIAPPYQHIQIMLLEQKQTNQMGTGVQKVGFQMKANVTEE